jgi:pseudaminic acid cytidylyltransferase
MNAKPRTVAIIPARGGSKRIPRKNIRDFGGKPMIAWSIEATLQSGVFDEVIVSTDDEEVAAVARQAGAQVPFVRPPEFSGDVIGLNAVLRHALGWLQEENGGLPERLGCIYATAPFLQPEDLRQACSLLDKKLEAEYVLSVCTFPSPVQRAMTTDEGGEIRFMWPELRLTPTQDLKEAFHDAGQFAIGRAACFMEHDSVLKGRCLPLIIPRHRCQDIDTPEDWEHALHLFAAMKAQDSLPRS